MRSVYAAAAGVGWLSLGACNAIFGITDLTHDEPASATAAAGGEGGAGAAGLGGHAGDGGAGGGPSCASGSVCRPSLAGALYLGWPTGGSCAAGTTPTELAECGGCNCDVESNGSCRLTVELHEDANCTAPQLSRSETGSQGTCVDVALTVAQGIHAIARLEPTPGACVPTEATVAATMVDGCVATPTGTCPGGVCVTDSAPCLVVPDGDDCPAPYQDQGTIYLEADVACTCSCTPTSSCPHSNSWVYAQDGCDGGQPLSSGSCVATGLSTVQSIWILPGGEQTQCAAAGAAASPRRLCCVPTGR